MKEYTRSTHTFNNETREWKYRGDIDEDKHDMWSVTTNERIKKLGHLWSFGVHALERDSWRYMRSIIDNTISMYLGHASDDTEEFEKFVKNTPNHREIIKNDILKELEILIELDMVRVRDNKQDYMKYWDT